ncbi:MAG: hypothetical protein ACLFSW_00720 [Halobacteriales archaeon]
MSGDALAVGRERERTYLRRLFRVLGAKGVVVLVAFPAVVFLSTDDVHPVLAGGLLAGGFVYALLVDSDSSIVDLHPDTEVKLKQQKAVSEKVDAVGVAFVLLVLGYVVLSLLSVPVDWRATVVAAGVVLGAVVYDYATVGGDEDDYLSVDVVGFAVAEVLVLRAVVTGTGWTGFADSPTFGAIAFLVYGGTIAAFAGHAAVTREIVVSRTDDEIHRTMFGVLGNVRTVEDEMTRKKMAAEMRRAADSLDGVEIPSVVKDEAGRVPVVVPTRQPDGRLFTTDVDEVLETASEEGFTGYVVYGNDVLIFRNGGLSKFYVDGEYGYDARELSDRITEATFHSVDHASLNELDDVTPSEERGATVVKEAAVSEDVEEEGATGEEDERRDGADTLEIGGEEIDVEEMFEKADEIIDELG